MAPIFVSMDGHFGRGTSRGDSRTIVSSLLNAATAPPTLSEECRRPWRSASSPAPASLRSSAPFCLPRSPVSSPATPLPRRIVNRRTRRRRRRRPRRRLWWWRRAPIAGGRMLISARGTRRRTTTRVPGYLGRDGGPTSPGSPGFSSPLCTSTSNTIGSLSHVRLQLHFLLYFNLVLVLVGILILP
jgi:hypothetical protein